MEYREFQFTEGGKRHFTLSEDSISVTGKGLNIHLLLRDLQPDYQTVRQRSSAYYVGLVACFLGLVGTAAFFINQELTDLFALAIIVGVIGLLILSFSWKKVDHAIFVCAKGDDGFSIARSGPDSSDFDLFIDELSQRIRQVQDEEG